MLKMHELITYNTQPTIIVRFFSPCREDENGRIDRLLLVLKIKENLIALIILFLLILVNYFKYIN